MPLNGLLHELYRPLTARPYRNNAGYTEVPPCAALRPYVRCFWGSRTPSIPAGGDVSPDTCMDILVWVDPLRGETRSVFCGINDRSVRSHGGGKPAILFAVRFYFWAVPLFSEESMREVCNLDAPAAHYFGGLERQLVEAVRTHASIEERARAAEAVLLCRLRQNREQPALMNALHAIFRAQGNLSIPDAAGCATLSSRQLERLFGEYVGVTPKKLASLVRYQYLLRETLFSPAFDVQDAVLHFGYADQSHLLKDFRRFHSMTPAEARRLALSDFYKTSPAASIIL